MRAYAGSVAALLAALVLAGCTGSADETDGAPSPAPGAMTTGVVEDGWSAPVEDPLYPDVGDPGVDTQRYWLDLRWDPGTRILQADERIRLRATEDADDFRLDLAEGLEVSDVRLDREPVAFRHEGKDLVIEEPVVADELHLLTLSYAGRPGPVPAPVQRSDFDTTGWTVTRDGSVWTMQEPYGAYTWYAVNDHPSDKAQYDVTISAPAPLVGVSNGELLSQRTVGGDTVTHWQLDEPASSYLVTVAIDDLEMTEDSSPSGVPITYWTPRDRPDLVARLQKAPAAMAWLEERLGPFPFDRLGFVVVDSQSGMETQEMITLGDISYATSQKVLVHEMAHQWYGDEVTPVDWSDVWMNEGMATFLQGTWEGEHGPNTTEEVFDQWATYDAQLRADAGPPADPDADSFGSANVYYIPAVMWEELRQRLGDDTFWRLAGEWPAAYPNGNADYDDITSWWSEQSGEDLSGFFEAWLLSEETPATS